MNKSWALALTKTSLYLKPSNLIILNQLKKKKKVTTFLNEYDQINLSSNLFELHSAQRGRC